MALEKIGLGGFLTFDPKQAVSGMGVAGRAANRFAGQFNGIVNVARQVGAGLGTAAQSMRSFGVAALPATAVMGVGVAKAQSFEKQMSAVGAVSQATASEMAILTAEAKRQGATTAFSATQAGEGLENLARAGFSVTEQVAALGPVLNAASADSIDLATAADIVSNTLRGLNLPATDAARAADVLALTSAKSNTNMVALGEAMKFAAPQAKTLNISLETTSAVLGAVADAGLRGTIGGTSFTQALVKLAKPSSAGAALLEQFNIKMTKTAEGGLDVVDVFKQVNAALKSETDVVKRAAMQTEIFGIRGQKAFAAASTAIDTGKLDQLVEAMAKAEGSAERMAKTRLDNLAGAFTLLTSAAEGFALETAGLFLGPMTQGVQGFTENLSNVVLVLQELNSEAGLTDETANKVGSTVVQVATGIKEGIDLVIETWVELRQQITDTIARFTGNQSPDMIKQFTKIATVMFIVAGAVAPILIAIGGLALFITSAVIPAFSAIGTILGAVFGGPVIPLLAAFGVALLLIRDEGESIGTTMMKLWEGIKLGADFVMTNAIEPLIAGFQYFPNVFGFVGSEFDSFISDMKSVFGTFLTVVKLLQPVFQTVFAFIGNVVGLAMTGLGLAFVTWMKVAGTVIVWIRDKVKGFIEFIINSIKFVSLNVGRLASFLGMDVGKALQDFGAVKFRLDETSLSDTLNARVKVAEEKAREQEQKDHFAQLAADSVAAHNQRNEDLKNELAASVGAAVGQNMPKELNVESKVCVDGKTIAKATSKHKQELNERAGFKATPWQRRAAVEQGAAPVGGV